MNPIDYWKYAFKAAVGGTCYYTTYDANMTVLAESSAAYTTTAFTFISLLSLSSNVEFVEAYFTTDLTANLSGNTAGAIGSAPTANSSRKFLADTSFVFGSESWR